MKVVACGEPGDAPSGVASRSGKTVAPPVLKQAY